MCNTQPDIQITRNTLQDRHVLHAKKQLQHPVERFDGSLIALQHLAQRRFCESGVCRLQVQTHTSYSKLVPSLELLVPNCFRVDTNDTAAMLWPNSLEGVQKTRIVVAVYGRLNQHDVREA